MPDTKLRPTDTVKSKDQSSEQRFGHVNAKKSQFIFEYHFYRISYTISENLKKLKFGRMRFLKVFW